MTNQTATALQGASCSDEAARVGDQLSKYFAVRFACWDGETARLLDSGDQPPLDPRTDLEPFICAVAGSNQIGLQCGTDGAMLLAVPMARSGGTLVATAVFVADPRGCDQSQVNGPLVDPNVLPIWRSTQAVWRREQLVMVAEAVRETLATRQRAERVEGEISQISQSLAATYEEISLLYTITQNLRISRPDEEIGRLALDRLTECIPAKGFAIEYLPWEEEGPADYAPGREAALIVAGEFPLNRGALADLTAKLPLYDELRPVVINRRLTSQPQWEFPQVRQLIIAPLAEGNRLIGWLAAVNHREDAEFGTVEANLLNSLGTLLGIHSSNRQLYHEQAEFVASLVRALVSAIDAKDPYTSGHSDRVARIAVRLALDLGCEARFNNTVYMAGLLHDVGKIGIDDSVLRKPGRLTDAEFEHIKLHPELGHKILADLKQLADVLPAVLHHHERWDGRGYPSGLRGEQIPRMARIMAVADAYDAMTSDRPYRPGMSDANVDAIFREGSGSHWDPAVVRAYFRAKDDILKIARRDATTSQTLPPLDDNPVDMATALSLAID